VQAFSDWAVIKFKENPTEYSDVWHVVKGLEMFVYILAISYYACSPLTYPLIKVVFYLFAYVSMRMAFFDILLNLIRGLKWNHIGNSIIDKLTKSWWYISKVIGLLGVIASISIERIWGFTEIFLNL